MNENLLSDQDSRPQSARLVSNWEGGPIALTAPGEAPGSLKAGDYGDETRSERRGLSRTMLRYVLRHSAGLDARALEDYTFEHHQTEHTNANIELDIFDGAGRLVFQGREFHSGIAGYWRPLHVSNAKAWGHSPAGRVLSGGTQGRRPKSQA